ncbi:MAG: hypothetical protein ACKVPJ_11150 [Chitinophagales bacterium]
MKNEKHFISIAYLQKLYAQKKAQVLVGLLSEVLPKTSTKWWDWRRYLG